MLRFREAKQGHLMPKAAWCPRIPPLRLHARAAKIDMSAQAVARGGWGFRFSLSEEMGLSWRGSAAVHAPFTPEKRHFQPTNVRSVSRTQPETEEKGGCSSSGHTLQRGTVRICRATGL